MVSDVRRIFVLFFVYMNGGVECKIKPTLKCPGSERKWTERSKYFNCTAKNEEMSYHCIKTETNFLGEVCTLSFVIVRPGSGCPFFNTTSGILERSLTPCNGPAGCPKEKDSPFYTDALYKYPACIQGADNEWYGSSTIQTIQEQLSTSITTQMLTTHEHEDFKHTSDESSTSAVRRSTKKRVHIVNSGNQSGGMYIPTFLIGIIGGLFLLAIVAFPIAIFMCVRKRKSSEKENELGTTSRDGPYSEINENALRVVEVETMSDISYLEPITHSQTYEYSYAYQDAVSKCHTMSKVEDIIAKYDLSTGLTMTCTSANEYQSLKCEKEIKTDEKQSFYQKLKTRDAILQNLDKVQPKACPVVVNKEKEEMTKRWNSL